MANALVVVDLTVFPREPSVARTLVGVHPVDACSTRIARLTRAFVNVNLAGASCVTSVARAAEVRNLVRAGAVVRTRLSDTLVDVRLTVGAGIARATSTGVLVDAVFTRSVLAASVTGACKIAFVQVKFAPQKK